MKTIVITGGFSFSPEQMARLEALGTLRTVTDIGSAEEWLQAVQGADVICSDGDYVYECLDKLSNVFVTYPYIELGSFDSEKLKERGVVVANTQGSNKNSIVEWAIFMILSLFRKFPSVLNATQDTPFELHESLEGKKVLVVGKGSIGSAIGSLCGQFGMEVDYFQRGGDLLAKSKDADLIVNSLNSSPSSKNLLDEAFFMSLKKGAYYVSFVRQHTYDLDGMLKSLDAGILAGVGIDCDPEAPGDTSNGFYQKVLSHKNALVTPHIAFSTTQASRNGKEFLVRNVEAYCKGEATNVVSKR